MSAVLSFDTAHRAADEAERRAQAFGYGALATRQFRREAARLAATMPAVVAAHRAVPPKSQRIGPTPPEAA